MDLDKLERFINLIERARELDFIAIQRHTEAMEKLNKQNIDIYNFYNKIKADQKRGEKEEKKEEEEEETVKVVNTKTTAQKQKQTQKKEMEMEMDINEDTVRTFLKILEKLNKTPQASSLPNLKTVKIPEPPEPEPVPPPPPPPPPPEPTPEPEPVEPESDPDNVVFNRNVIERIRDYAAVISDVQKSQAKTAERMHTVFIENHRKAYALWKEIDDNLNLVKDRTL